MQGPPGNGVIGVLGDQAAAVKIGRKRDRSSTRMPNRRIARTGRLMSGYSPVCAGCME
jgi:hypothetical protein